MPAAFSPLPGDITIVWNPLSGRGDWAMQVSQAYRSTSVKTFVEGDDGASIEADDGSLIIGDSPPGMVVTSGPDLMRGGDLGTAILVSLFTDRLATTDYVPPPPGDPRDRRGWWADTYNTRPIGSNLWQLERSVKSNSTTILLLAQDYAAEALQWLIDAGAVASFSIQAQWQNLTFLALGITATMPTGATQAFLYSWLWANP